MLYELLSPTLILYFPYNIYTSALLLTYNLYIYIYIYIYPGPGVQPSAVIISGVQVSNTVIFTPGQMPMTLPGFDVSNDNTALETDEIYQLSFISPPPSQDVTLGNPTIITIMDDDGELI